MTTSNTPARLPSSIYFSAPVPPPFSIYVCPEPPFAVDLDEIQAIVSVGNQVADSPSPSPYGTLPNQTSDDDLLNKIIIIIMRGGGYAEILVDIDSVDEILNDLIIRWKERIQYLENKAQAQSQS
jgi:hypothetical protein